MDLTTMIVVIVCVILAFALVISLAAFKHEERRMALVAGNQGDSTRLEQELAATQAEMAKLRNRVQVLERLMTDDDRKLAGEIDRLRTEERL